MTEAEEIKFYKELHRVREARARLFKENKLLCKELNSRESLLDHLKSLTKGMDFSKVALPPAPRPSAKKRNMTLELLLSDLHFGKKTKTFDLAVARRRMIELREVLLKEVTRTSTLYHVHRVILALLGDIIESETMHGVESARGCEFGNSRQMEEAIKCIFFEVILPIAKTGVEVDIPAVTGNHDRSEDYRTFHNPGENNLTWVIYQMLKVLSEQAGLKNVKFHIPTGPYVTLKIYQNLALYEHGDNIRNTNRDSIEKFMNKRQTQLKKVIDFFRMGHYHEYVAYGRGRIIVNESLPGPDSYSDVLGYDSHAGQTLNYYVETEERPSCFFRSFPIYLR